MTPHSTLREAMEKVVAKRAHRLFVISNDKKPMGVLSLTDIIRKLSEVLMR